MCIESGGAHPCEFLSEFFFSKYPEFEFEFSVYRYFPRAIEDQRRVFRCVGSEINSEWIWGQIRDLDSEHDLAIHSGVFTKDETVGHIPMVDFYAEVRLPEYKQLTSIVKEFGVNGFGIFETGRSFHGYGDCLILGERWHEYMGTLLLVNPPEGPSVVDARWIGHRLRSGFGSLRLSKNSTHYLSLPRRVFFKT